MRPYTLIFLSALCLALLTGCVSGTGTGSVSGTIKFRDTIAPPGGMFEVEIYNLKEDGGYAFVSRADIPNTGKPEIPFAIAYDKADLVLKDTYIVQAALRNDKGTLMYSSGPWYTVITQGRPVKDVELWVAALAPAKDEQP